MLSGALVDFGELDVRIVAGIMVNYLKSHPPLMTYKLYDQILNGFCT